MSDYITCLRDLVIANRILAHEGVVDAYGHVSVRHPDDSQRFLLSRSRSPELVTLDDIMEFTLDGDAVSQQDRAIYSERFIHGALYESRPDVQAVVHNHSLAVIPFSITNTPINGELAVS
jgi:ribulose-5-phosphate 4-epimerase/fuculose-1-phosphate aldolase